MREPNPFATPSSDVERYHLPEAPASGIWAEHRLREPGKEQPWTLRLDDQRLYLTPHGEGPTIALGRNDFLERGEVHVGLVTRLLVVRVAKPIRLPLDEPALWDLRAWLEPVIDGHLQQTLRRKFRFSLPIGIFLALPSLASLETPAEISSLIVGAGLVVASIILKIRPAPFLFLVAAAWWVAFAISTGLWARESDSPLMFGFSGIALLLAAGSVKTHRFFATRPAAGPAAGP